MAAILKAKQSVELAFRVRLKRIISLFLATSLLILLETPASSGAINWQEDMLKQLNAIRTENSAAPLTICRPLANSAQRYARSMANLDFFSHQGKDGSDIGDRILKAGYNWRNSRQGAGYGENIAAGQMNVASVMKSWKISTGHFKNMVDTRFTHVGFGQARNSNSKYKIYWVQNFGFGASCK